MKSRWRIYERLLVTMGFAGFLLIYLFQNFNPEQHLVNKHLAFVFAQHQLLFHEWRNQVLPEAGLVLLCYLAYLWVNLFLVPKLWPSMGGQSVSRPPGGLRKKLLLPVWVFLSLLFSAAFLLSAYFREEWRFRDHLAVLFQQPYGMAGEKGLIWAGVAVFLGYLLLREKLIAPPGIPTPRLNRLLMAVNQLTAAMVVFLLFICLLQAISKISLMILLPQFNLLATPPLLFGLWCMYYFFPKYEGKRLFSAGLLTRLSVAGLLLILPVPFLLPGRPGNIIPFAWLFELLIVVPVSRLLYREQKTRIPGLNETVKEMPGHTAALPCGGPGTAPHFLQQLLDAIQASALQEGASRTVGYLRLLSDIMPPGMTIPQAPNTALAEEFNRLQTYVELRKQQLPYPERHTVELRLNADRQDYRVVPMLLLPFAENVFERAMSLPDPVEIRMTLLAEKDTLRFEIVSTGVEHPGEGENPLSGPGWTQLQERLTCAYPGKHQLAVASGQGGYTVALTIHL